MIGYKHLDRKWAGAFLSGASIQLGSLAYYRNMEWERADRTEGLQANYLDGVVNRDDAAARDLERLGHFKIAGRGVHFENVVTLDGLANYLIFCCSAEPDVELARAKGQAIIEIDLQPFVAELLLAVPVLGHTMATRVRYDKEAGNLQTGLRIADPFQKPKACEWENEIRVLFQGYHSLRETVRLTVPRAWRFMRPLEL